MSIKVSIIGASGYTGSELIRLLVNHPDAEIVSAVSRTGEGKKISDIFTDLINETEIKFTDRSSEEADIVFLCLQHGTASTFLKENPELLKKRIIDLSRDFRLSSNCKISDNSFVYGLPELNKELIKKAEYVANPGCFATAIQLGLLPLAHHNLLKNDIIVNAITGSTGAGVKTSDTTHFSWRQNNASVYQAFEHAHNDEIVESIKNLQQDFDKEFVFIPQRGNFTRGILASSIVEINSEQNEIFSMYLDYYQDDFFTNIVENEINMKQIVNTNKCLINIKKHKNHLLIVSVIDNLLKGAAGQAVQNMNLMFGLEEQTGLKLKSSIF